MNENEQLALNFKSKFFRKEITLYEAMGFFMHQNVPMPPWLVDAIEQGFDDRLSGKRDLDQVFGLTPRPGQQIDKSARRLTYAPSVYWEAVRRSENGEAIDLELFEKIAADFRPTFEREWPDKKPPAARTLKEWYLDELKSREPDLAKTRNKTKSKTA